MSHQTPGSQKAVRVYQAIARYALYTLAFALPLTVLPWTADIMEVNKQALLVVVTTIAMIAWLGAMITEKRLHVVKSWVLIPAVLVLIAAIISSAISIAPVYSWIGQGMQEYMSFMTTISFFCIFLLAMHVLRDLPAQRRTWSFALLGSMFASLIGALAAIGKPIFDTLFVGTPNALAVYLIGMSVLACAIWLTASKEGVVETGAWGVTTKIAGTITALATLVLLLALDIWFLWVLLLMGLVVLFGFALLRAEEFPHANKFSLPMFLAVVSCLFLFLPSPITSKLPAEITPSYKGTWSIARATISESPAKWLFGSGPGTFMMDYSKYKDPIVNQTQLWDTRFDRGASHLLNLLAMTGVFGVLTFLFFITAVKMAALKVLTKEHAHGQWKATFIAFSVWSVFVLATFLYNANITLLFFLWLSSGIVVAHATKEARYIPFSQSPRGALLTTFFFVFISVGLLTMLFMITSRYSSEISFAKAVNSQSTIDDLDEVILDLDRAARLNKWNDHYYRTLSSALLYKTAQLVQNPEENAAQLQQFISLTITSARKAVELSPNYVVNWAFMGDTYREFMLLTENAGNLALASYDRAIELAPTNPKYYTAKARVHLTAAEQAMLFLENEDQEVATNAKEQFDKALEDAVTLLSKSVELKGDYGPAHYYLAVAYERQGNIVESISRLELLRSANQLDVGIHFQLGILYFKQGKYEMAEASLKRAIEIAPNYSNARWYLAAVYEQRGDIEAAIAEVEKVKELNPENTTIDQRLERLKQGAGPAIPEVLPEPVEEGEAPTDIEQVVIEEVTE